MIHDCCTHIFEYISTAKRINLRYLSVFMHDLPEMGVVIWIFPPEGAEVFHSGLVKSSINLISAANCT